VLIDGGEAEEVVDNVEEEFRLDEVMAEEVNQLLTKEERLKQVGKTKNPKTLNPKPSTKPWGGTGQGQLAQMCACRMSDVCSDVCCGMV
jgi:hypothetical protein